MSPESSQQPNRIVDARSLTLEQIAFAAKHTKLPKNIPALESALSARRRDYEDMGLDPLQDESYRQAQDAIRASKDILGISIPEVAVPQHEESLSVIKLLKAFFTTPKGK